MATSDTQTYDNHRRFVPMYHYVTAALLLVNFGYAAYQVITGASVGTAIAALTAFALLAVFFYARAFATKVQDRVIRLEERLRLERVLPDDLRAKVPTLTTPQLIGLRFASDSELGDLVRRAVEDNLDGEAIKKQIKDWRPDFERA